MAEINGVSALIEITAMIPAAVLADTARLKIHIPGPRVSHPLASDRARLGAIIQVDMGRPMIPLQVPARHPQEWVAVLVRPVHTIATSPTKWIPESSMFVPHR
jgi:hypothetical protein